MARRLPPRLFASEISRPHCWTANQTYKDNVKLLFGTGSDVEHYWDNASGAPTRGLFQIRPAGMADFVFVQLHRAFAGEAGSISTAIQTFILIGTHGKHTAWPIRTLCFLVSPTARLFGYRSYYEPVDSEESSLPTRIATDPS